MMSIRTRALWALDPFFPPDPTTFLAPAAQSAHEVQKAPSSMGRYLEQLGHTDVDVLDFGCGWGGESLWLADRVRSVIGVDVDPDNIAQAESAKRQTRTANCTFTLSDGATIPLHDNSVDAAFSTDTFEHVQNLPAAFSELYRVLRPGGWLIASWGPLFYSPNGYHLYWACKVPYAHLIGGFESIVALRDARAPEPTKAKTWTDMGLNQRRFTDYSRAAADSGFLMHNFARVPVRGLHRLASLPMVGDLLTFGARCAIQKPPLSI